jgi:hypothetical protein
VQRPFTPFNSDIRPPSRERTERRLPGPPKDAKGDAVDELDVKLLRDEVALGARPHFRVALPLIGFMPGSLRGSAPLL